ncbi:MAG: hypothetical protein ACLTSX_05535 [Collinsella sp.]
MNAGALTQGEVMAFVNYMTQTLLSIVYVANLVVVFTKAGASAGRILEVLDCEPGIRSGADAATEPDEHAEFADRLCRDALRFAYPGSTVNAVDHVTLELPCAAGRSAIIGGTGSGKSTLVSLVCRVFTK